MLHRHLVEENCKDALLHLARIFCPKNDHLFIGKVDGYTRRTCHSGGISISGKGPGIIDGVIRVEVLQLFSCRAYEHIAHEQRVVGSSSNDSNIDPVTLIPSSIAINDIDAVSSV